MDRLRRLVVAIMLIASPLVVIACAGPSAPTPIPAPSVPMPVPTPTPTPPPVPVMAPAPDGVSPLVWPLACMSDNQLHKPLGAVHVLLPADTDDATRTLFASAAAEITESVGSKTLVDMATGTGATFSVNIVPGLSCGALQNAGGCTTPNLDPVTGEVTGGKIEFVNKTYMNIKMVVKHELYRTLGVLRNNPLPGVMASPPTTDQPTPDELGMFNGRYRYPNGAICS